MEVCLGIPHVAMFSCPLASQMPVVSPTLGFLPGPTPQSGTPGVAMHYPSQARIKTLEKLTPSRGVS